MNEHWTNILPAPKEDLDPEAALKWLHEDFMGASLALGYGLEAEDEETREAFHTILLDLIALYRAAVEAVAEQETVRVSVRESPVDLASWTLDLTRVVAYRCEIDDGNGYYEDGFSWFAEVLKDRLLASEAAA